MSPTLPEVRSSLERQEETIIFSLLERAQFARNEGIYRVGGVSELKSERSFLEYFLLETELLHARLGRYHAEDEAPFFPRETGEITPVIERSSKRLAISLTGEIIKFYVDKIVPEICKEGVDNEFGSASVCDIYVLQALSRRVHYCQFIIEAKMAANPSGYESLIKAKDESGLLRLLTDEVAEARLLERIRKKVISRQKLPPEADPEARHYVDPEKIVELYKSFIMPMSKKLQVLHCLGQN